MLQTAPTSCGPCGLLFSPACRCETWILTVWLKSLFVVFFSALSTRVWSTRWCGSLRNTCSTLVLVRSSGALVLLGLASVQWLKLVAYFVKWVCRDGCVVLCVGWCRWVWTCVIILVGLKGPAIQLLVLSLSFAIWLRIRVCFETTTTVVFDLDVRWRISVSLLWLGRFRLTR